VKARLSRAGALAVVALAALLTPALAGCGPDYDHTDITSVHQSPLGGSVNYTRISVPAGMVVTAHLASYDDSHGLMSMELRSRDTSIVEVTTVISDHDYAFFGLRAGTTQVELRADNKLVLVLDAVVTDQPPAP
jgi:hypothetical protein